VWLYAAVRNLLYRGGLTIYSTQDSVLQTLCETEVNRDAWYSSDAQVSMVIMEPATGQVKAIVGGRGEKENSLVLNRAVSSVRQPGSTIKVVGAYAAALDGGEATLGTVYDDAPYAYQDGTAIRNAGGICRGRITVRKAVADSVNVVALKCFQQVGLDTVFSKLQQFGFGHLTDADRVEALALGGTHGGVTNLELTAAYSAIANQGVYLEPVYYTKVVDREGRVLISGTPEKRTVIRPVTAALLTEAMKSVMTDGTGTVAAFSGMPLAGKSGTTTGMKDVWFVGYSPYYACGIWGGYDDGAGQRSSSYVKNIWRVVMEQAHEGKAYREFAGADALTTAEICTKCGNLAVEGLCDVTVQGDMTQTEYFAPGTEPAEPCGCHVKMSYCRRSGEPAGNYCWLYGVEPRV
jgi:penicillin-binding protein 1A